MTLIRRLAANGSIVNQSELSYVNYPIKDTYIGRNHKNIKPRFSIKP